MTSHADLVWRAAGSPSVDLPHEGVSACCATCGMNISAGVPISEIETPTTAGHADLFRFGSRVVCDGCAWLFGVGKGRPGNFIAYGDRLEYTVISLESVVEYKRPWLHVLRDLSALPVDTPTTGVMTTDVKPRLWHRARLARVGRFGLYVHAPEYDVSEWRDFRLRDCLDAIETITRALAAGYSKASCYFGLLRDFARFSKDPDAAMRMDTELAAIRTAPHFLPALIAAGITKEKRNEQSSIKSRAEPVSTTAGGDKSDQAQLGLL